ncbi:unnamed protein product [Nezara viridula]|uniref:Uncharacterized protein n=1 Tax=Nezara viridula TaxID=85310 RepID=A0A9P0HK23_NEZVI|nr:unnamed protein product [Nezara viridula]
MAGRLDSLRPPLRHTVSIPVAVVLEGRVQVRAMDDCRLRSRRRAARALAEKRRRGTAGVSCDEESPTRERAKPPRRKKKEPIFEEDVIDGFAILSFKNYEDIEVREQAGTRSIPPSPLLPLGAPLLQIYI